jgi:hypothetical protein
LPPETGQQTLDNRRELVANNWQGKFLVADRDRQPIGIEDYEDLRYEVNE